tara:strand:- start:334 stop:1290 length:957 start_codon:yes stop_codon:yes gene_type:complete
MRVSKTYKQSEWLVEGPEEMASLKADQAREVEDLKRRHEDEVENLKLKHERETERQSKKDEAEAERESQQEDTLPDIEDSKYLQDAVNEGKLVADDLMIIDSAVKSIKQEMVKSLKKNREAGVNFINSMFRSAGLKSKVSAKMQSKGRLFLKQELVKENEVAKKLKKIKGLTKDQLRVLSTLPTPMLTTVINQLSTLVMSEDKEEQDRDIKDREGTQPKKYYKGLDKKTKEKRDAHFKQGKTGPAPGDEDEDGKPVKTKKSVHTKKFAKMFGEKLGKNADAGDYIKDFRKSDAPQFKGKSDKKIQKMAIAAYLDKKDK